VSPNRTLPFLLGLTLLASLNGCGSSNHETADTPEASPSRSEQGGEVASLDSDRHLAEEAGAGAEPGSPASPQLSKMAAIPKGDDANAPASGGADPDFNAPAFSALRAPSAARTSPVEIDAPVIAPRLVAPMPLAPAPVPEPAARAEALRSTTTAPTTRMLAAPMEIAAPSAAPSAARSATEMSIGAAPLESMAAESPAPEPLEATATIAKQPVAEEREGYSAVTVFYGTDRSSNATSGAPDQPHRFWFYASGICLLLFGLFAAVARLSTRKKSFAGLAVMSFSAGSVMAVMGTIAWLQRDGAVSGPKLEYGNGRGAFVMGTCEVSIPTNHQVAELEAPSVFKLDFVENPTKHVVLLDIEEKDSETFFSQLRQRVDQSTAKDAFVFVHGFNVTFEDAARRTAQLAYDLKFQGAPIFYSWPSQGGLFQYAVDETNVVWTVPHLHEFLKQIADQAGAQSVHLIAHSMGNRALTSALRELSLEMQEMPPRFHEVVLTAPDIDADVFRRDIAPAIVKTAKRVTLYASSNDEALVLSKQVHGYPRAGDTGDELVVIPGIETIDVSAVDTSLLGHTYYGDNATVISDMVDLVKNSKSARERSWLEMTPLNDLFYWIFRADRQAVGTATTDPATRY